MGDVVNLRQARKTKARTEKANKAQANRMAFGRPKAERLAHRLKSEQLAKFVDGHKRDPDPAS